jgi:hypothetical protein
MGDEIVGKRKPGQCNPSKEQRAEVKARRH